MNKNKIILCLLLLFSLLVKAQVYNPVKWKTSVEKVSDIEFDLENGKITALKIPVPGKGINFFSKNEDITVLWTNIKKIGDDIILVEEDK